MLQILQKKEKNTHTFCEKNKSNKLPKVNIVALFKIKGILHSPPIVNMQAGIDRFDLNLNNILCIISVMLECRFIQAESAVNGGLMNETTIGKYHSNVYRQVYIR